MGAEPGEGFFDALLQRKLGRTEDGVGCLHLLANAGRRVLMSAHFEKAEDFGFCACAAAAPRAECDGAGDAGWPTGGSAVRGVLRHQTAGLERSRISR